jgi:transaldolase
MAADGGDCELVLAQFAQAGVNAENLAAQLQDDGAKSFAKSGTSFWESSHPKVPHSSRLPKRPVIL